MSRHQQTGEQQHPDAASGSAVTPILNDEVAIVIPLSARSTFLDEEVVSLRHLQAHLAGYDRFFLVPEGLSVSVPGIRNTVFGDHYFGSVAAHQRLLFSTEFYRAFSRYRYLLIYHLDALVFADELMQWCAAGHDYIAPPWIVHPDTPYFGNKAYEGKVGNGGFSLRRIDSFLKVLESKVYTVDPWRKAWQMLRGKPVSNSSSRFLPWRAFMTRYNGVESETATYQFNEDHFWGSRASHYLPSFRVAPQEVALSFAFECVPRFCFERNGGRLPFGCHAWGRYDKTFWEQFVLPEATPEMSEPRLSARE